MRKLIRSVLLIMSFILALTSTAFASNQELSSQQKEKVMQEIIIQIQEIYGSNYSFENFDWNFTNVQSDNDKLTAEVKITADMTLIQNATEMPYYKGLEQALNEATSAVEIEVAQTLMKGYVKEIDSIYYNKPDRTEFYFLVQLLNEDIISSNARAGMELISSISCFGIEGLYPLEELKISDNQAKENGEEAVADAVSTMLFNENQISPLASTYNRLGARDYALNHFNEHKDYASNCANFVSYCLNKGGGLPQTSNWSPGLGNWIRTGHNGVDGVCIYLNYYENFAWTSNRSTISAGAVVSWNAESHVGITTYGDGSTIKFSARTIDRNNVTLPAGENVSFYQR